MTPSAESGHFRVLFLIQNVPYSLDTRVRREAHVVMQMGGTATVICPSDGSEMIRQLDGVRIFQYPKPNFGKGFLAHIAEYIWSLFFHFLYTLFLRFRHGFDVIHGSNPPDMFWLIAAPYSLFGTIYIFDQHDLVPELYEVRYGSKLPWLKNFMLWLERRNFQLASHVISTNESFRQIAINRGNKSPEKVTVVRNGPWLQSDFPEVVPNNKIRDLGRVVVGYLGIMNPQDHLENLIEAARLVREERNRSDIGFVLIGSGDSYNDLLRLRNSLGLQHAVYMPGTLPWSEVLSILHATDFCVQPDLPTKFNKHLTMNKLMEYMAIRKPCIAYAMPETVVTGGDAVTYARDSTPHALADAIVELADDPVRRQQLSEKCYARIKDGLSWEHQMHKLIEVYRKVLGPHNEPDVDA